MYVESKKFSNKSRNTDVDTLINAIVIVTTQ